MAFPVAVSIGTYDRILSLPYMYYGPVIDLPFLPWKVQFRGRPLHEWLALILLVPVAWAVLDVGLAVVAVTPASPTLQGIDWAIVHIAGTWTAASWLAGIGYRRFINHDETFMYLATTAWTEAVRVAWARGPIDRVVAVISAALWLLITQALAVTPLPWLVAWPAAFAAARALALWVVHTFETPVRARDRALKRAHRRAHNTLIAVNGEPRVEVTAAA